MMVSRPIETLRATQGRVHRLRKVSRMGKTEPSHYLDIMARPTHTPKT